MQVDNLKMVLLQYGPVFTFRMAGKSFTYLVGQEASALLFNSKNEDLNAEDVYGKLVTPVFGKGVAYDVPNDVSNVVGWESSALAQYCYYH